MSKFLQSESGLSSIIGKPKSQRQRLEAIREDRTPTNTYTHRSDSIRGSRKPLDDTYTEDDSTISSLTASSLMSRGRRKGKAPSVTDDATEYSVSESETATGSLHSQPKQMRRPNRIVNSRSRGGSEIADDETMSTATSVTAPTKAKKKKSKRRSTSPAPTEDGTEVSSVSSIAFVDPEVSESTASKASRKMKRRGSRDSHQAMEDSVTRV